MRATVIERDCKSQYLAPANCKFAGTGGKDPIRNAPKTGQYQQDVILLVYPSHESRENASRLVYEKYRKKH